MLIIPLFSLLSNLRNQNDFLLCNRLPSIKQWYLIWVAGLPMWHQAQGENDGKLSNLAIFTANSEDSSDLLLFEPNLYLLSAEVSEGIEESIGVL